MLTKPTYKVQICCGTMCHIMGGAELHLLHDRLPDSLKGKVDVEGLTCMGKCNTGKNEHPCALVNGEVIENASIQKIITKLLTTHTNDLL